jgi:replicative DNA helicase
MKRLTDQQKSDLALSNIQAEQAVLGSIIISSDALINVRHVLTITDFAWPPHRELFDAMLAIGQTGVVDMVTLEAELQRRLILDDIGYQQDWGFSYLTYLVNAVPTSAYAEYYARIVHSCALRRQLVNACAKTAEAAYKNEDPQEALTLGLGLLTNVGKGVAVTMQASSDAIDELSIRATEWFESPKDLWGISTGLLDLDRWTGGLERTELVLLAGRPGMGKCLGKGTRIVMADGSLRAVEDIRTGDKLLGPDSRSRLVLGTTKGRGPMYRIQQTHGLTYRANAQHTLILKRSKNEGAHKHGDIKHITIAEIMSKGKSFTACWKGFKVGIELPERPVPLPPYFLGLWLGNGRSDGVELFTPFDEIKDWMFAWARERGEQLHIWKKDNCYGLRITGGKDKKARQHSVLSMLRTMNVLQNKHIPQEYIQNSRAVRLQLLAGLIDSDGYSCQHYNAAHAPAYEIMQKNQALAEQIKYLCDSLGFHTHLSKKIARIKRVGFECEVSRLYFSGNVETIPVLVKRRQATAKRRRTDWTMSGLQISPDGEGEFFGFELDGDPQFLLEDMTVLHNSALALQIARHVANQKLGVCYFSLEMGQTQLMLRLACQGARLDADLIRRGKASKEEQERFWQEMAALTTLPIWWCCKAGMEIGEIANEVAKLQTRQDIALVIVDYLQLMSSQGENQNIRVAQISQGLAKLAKSTNTCVLALSQLSRGIESRSDPQPRLADLRDSGSLEQDADKILFLWRKDEVLSSTPKNMVDAPITLAKNRNGVAGVAMFDMGFIGKWTLFVDKEKGASSDNPF